VRRGRFPRAQAVALAFMKFADRRSLLLEQCHPPLRQPHHFIRPLPSESTNRRSLRVGPARNPS
jgi:hypothetical protein